MDSSPAAATRSGGEPSPRRTREPSPRRTRASATATSPPSPLTTAEISGATDAAKKISDEAAAAATNAIDDKFQKMADMVLELTRDLGAERAARLKLEETIHA